MIRNAQRSIAICIAGLIVTPIFAQSELGTSMKRHYRLRSVSCTTCHQEDVKEKSRDKLTEFGNVIAKLVEGQRITERLDAVEDADKAEKDKVEDAIEAEFIETIKKLEVMIAPSGKTYAEAIPGGEIEGIKPRK